MMERDNFARRFTNRLVMFMAAAMLYGCSARDIIYEPIKDDIAVAEQIQMPVQQPKPGAAGMSAAPEPDAELYKILTSGFCAQRAEAMYKGKPPLERYIPLIQSSDERLLQSISFEDKRTLDELIIDSGFLPFATNCRSIEEADVILLGDIHNSRFVRIGLDRILDAYIRRDDAVLVEAARDHGTFIDFRMFMPIVNDDWENMPIYPFRGFVRVGDPLLDEEPPKNWDEYVIRVMNSSRDIVEDLSRLSSGLEAIGEQMEQITEMARLIEIFERTYRVYDLMADEPKFGISLVSTAEGRFIGIDALEEIKNRSKMYHTVPIELRLISYDLEKDNELHPFHRWLLYEDLKLFGENATKEEKLAAMNAEIERIYEDGKRIPYDRQLEILDNLVYDVKNRGNERRAVVLGAEHLRGFPVSADLPGQNLINRLDAERIRYIIFLPDELSIALHARAEGSQKNVKQEEIMEKADFTYYYKVVQWYAEMRASQGVPPYTGSFDGLVENAMQLLK